MSCASSCRSLEDIFEMEVLRFEVGDSVTCKAGCKTTRATWQEGEIVKLWWRHPQSYIFHPYQVKLRTCQHLIYVPIDDDDVIRKIERVWWEVFMDQKDVLDEEVVDAIGKLGEGKDPNAKNYKGETALLRALKCRWQAAVHALLRLKVDPNCSGQHCERAVNLAVAHYTGSAQADLTKALLEANADLRLQDKDPDKDPEYDSKSFREREWHRTALHYAAERGHVEIMRLLLEARATLDVQDAQYKMPLHLAIENNEFEAVRLLVHSRADICRGHMGIGLGTSPLIDAAYRDDQELIRLLISAKANLDHRGKQDMTALHVAARGRHEEAAKLLIEARADATLLAGGKTAGELAFKNGLSDIASLLGNMGRCSHEHLETSAQLPDAKTRPMLFIDEPVAKHLRAC